MPAAKGRLSGERVVGGLARRGEPLAARVLDLGAIRRALHRRALRAWQASEAPLIVCAGNINRSAFAEQLARRRPESRASSAGFYPEAGRPSPPLTVAAAAARGVDLGAHRSRTIDDAIVAGADAIFVFDVQNLARLAVRWPRALRRTHLLGALADRGAVVIADPHGYDRAGLDAVLTQIAHAVERAERSREGAS
ncbi:MAG: protein tyrosine phosphatase [Solirubrobacteraceae bacterium]|jgi:protein-tyrosine phosphatase